MVLLLFGLGVFLADRVLKIFILNNFVLGETQGFIPGVLQLTYIQNTGMAFGFLRDHQWIPMVLTPLLLLGVLFVLFRKQLFPNLVCRLALAGIFAGGLGNWVDRLLYGFVVDMFEFTFVRFAVFNLADVFITVGGTVFIVVYAVTEWRAERKKVETEQAESSGE